MENLANSSGVAAHVCLSNFDIFTLLWFDKFCLPAIINWSDFVGKQQSVNDQCEVQHFWPGVENPKITAGGVCSCPPEQQQWQWWWPFCFPRNESPMGSSCFADAFYVLSLNPHCPWLPASRLHCITWSMLEYDFLPRKIWNLQNGLKHPEIPKFVTSEHSLLTKMAAKVIKVATLSPHLTHLTVSHRAYFLQCKAL